MYIKQIQRHNTTTNIHKQLQIYIKQLQRHKTITNIYKTTTETQKNTETQTTTNIHKTTTNTHKTTTETQNNYRHT